eukprot:1190229-Prorocentrum_minimum.AAC.1
MERRTSGDGTVEFFPELRVTGIGLAPQRRSTTARHIRVVQHRVLRTARVLRGEGAPRILVRLPLAPPTTSALVYAGKAEGADGSTYTGRARNDP